MFSSIINFINRKNNNKRIAYKARQAVLEELAQDDQFILDCFNSLTTDQLLGVNTRNKK